MIYLKRHELIRIKLISNLRQYTGARMLIQYENVQCSVSQIITFSTTRKIVGFK